MAQGEYRLVQLQHPERARNVALVREPELVLLKGMHTIYDLALGALELDNNILSIVKLALSDETLDYEEIYQGRSPWKIMAPIDQPDNAFNILVSGTGLTHKNSALSRQLMHRSQSGIPTDSLRMYKWGVEGGHPPAGRIGSQPEWFYKGTHGTLKAHNEYLEVPSYADDGGDEPEIACVYIVDSTGRPCRIGFCAGNEFSDHIMEKKNYLYLAPSKLRNCSIGPELVLDANFEDAQGEVRIIREQKTLWKSAIASGEKNMAHSLQNLEHHLFKYPSHRTPNQVHVHFLGADAFSFGADVKLEDEDIMEVEWQGFGRPLRNRVRMAKKDQRLVAVKSLI